MIDIKFDKDVTIGGELIDTIKVEPLTFKEFANAWSKAQRDPKPEVAINRHRIIHQTHFIKDGERVIPEYEDIGRLPISVGKAIDEVLDEGQGVPGNVIGDGDGITKSLIYKLGKPFEIAVSGKKTAIEELEFKAEVYADVEDILATDGDLRKTLKLIETLAEPVGVSLMRLPGWAMDSLTTADGVTIMREVLPRF